MIYQKTLETQETKLGTLYVYNIWDILKYFYIYFIALTVSINTPSKFNNTYPKRKKKKKPCKIQENFHLPEYFGSSYVLERKL